MKNMKSYCFALDLKMDPDLISEYKQYHRNVWPEVIESIRSSGIEQMEIFQVENRLFMMIEVNETYDSEEKEKKDRENPKTQEWEQLMWKYQQAMQGGKSGQKWRLMKRIFDLKSET